LLDEVGQYFKVNNKKNWAEMSATAGFGESDTAIYEINKYFDNTYQGVPKTSRHDAALSVIALFNRFSEESLDPKKCKTKDETLKKLLKMYEAYQDTLSLSELQKEVDFSLLQKAAFDHIQAFPDASSIYEHVIIDEYQDTNAIQEQIFFALANGHKNICVVGDDDQALYRFRGATVENLVEFETRCEKAIGQRPLRIDLDVNYRSRKKIVDAYTDFIRQTDWKKEKQSGYYRINDKNITAHSKDSGVSVALTTPNPDKFAVCREVVNFVYNLKQSGKITDYNQCAFLFPAMKQNTRVEDFKKAFADFNEEMGFTGTTNEIKYYAPRSGRFLDTGEAKAIWGIFMLIFDRPHGHVDVSFRTWMHDCEAKAHSLAAKDANLKQFIEDKKQELLAVSKDYRILLKAIEENGLDLKEPFPSAKVKIFYNIPGLSARAKRNLVNKYLYNILVKREQSGNPFAVSYILNRATSVDWSVLDLFYQLNGFDHFREMYLKAEDGTDEGPICNLGLITQYLSRFMEDRGPVITASRLQEGRFVLSFFASYTYALFRLGETEYENVDDPFPKGRVPFLTIHQSKGLEFPVVVLGSPDRRRRDADIKEEIIRALIPNKEGEPLEKIPTFDTMRMFYVALSRAQNLLVLARFGRGKQTPPTSYYETGEFTSFFAANKFPTIPSLNIDTIPATKEKTDDLGKSYSYTSDFIYYKKCPRQYMVMRKYGFVASSSEIMFFGSLIHQTIEDLHNHLLSQKGVAP
jgi:DNA helicase-2/ATP-dependent DNA helicase PcrA